MKIEELLKIIIESGISIEDIIEELEEYLADIGMSSEDDAAGESEESDIEVEVDEEGFYSLK